MLKEKERLITFILRMLDICLVFLSVWITLEVAPKHFPEASLQMISPPHTKYLFGATFIAYFFSFLFFGYYRTFRNQTYEQVFSKTVIGVLWGSMGLFFILFLIDISEISRGVLFILSGLCMLFLIISRSLAYFLIGVIRKKGFDSKILISGWALNSPRQ